MQKLQVFQEKLWGEMSRSKYAFLKKKKSLPPQKLTCQQKTHHWKMYFLLKLGIFQCHVSFQGSKSFCPLRIEIMKQYETHVIQKSFLFSCIFFQISTTFFSLFVDQKKSPKIVDRCLFSSIIFFSGQEAISPRSVASNYPQQWVKAGNATVQTLFRLIMEGLVVWHESSIPESSAVYQSPPKPFLELIRSILRQCTFAS